MRYLIFLSALLAVLSVQANSETIKVRTADGTEQVLDVYNNDPFRSSCLYVGILGMNNTGFAGSSKTTIGMGADVKYYWGNIRLHAYYAQGFFNPFVRNHNGFMNMEGDMSYCLRTSKRERDIQVRMTSASSVNAHSFSVPADVKSSWNARLGINRMNVPLTAVIRNSQGNVHLTSSTSNMFAAGLSLSQVYDLDISSAELDERHVSCVRSWYADILYSPFNSISFYSSTQAVDAMQVMNEHAVREVKLGARIGYEWTSPVRWKNAGAFYRLEAGCRPGFKGYSDGAYISFNAGLNLGW